MGKKAIIVVSFGTSHPDAMKSCIESTENSIYQALPDYEPYRAFTSEFIVRKLAKRDGTLIDNPAQALERLKNAGFSTVVAQPLHMLPGYEYQEVKDAVSDFEKRGCFDRLLLGEPLLYANEDYAAVTGALKKHMPPSDNGTACILMGHGTGHFSNACYYRLQSHMQDAGVNAYIANVEGDPPLESVIKKIKKKGIRRIRLMPFMLVAGEHAKKDMAGEKDSWENILEKEGFEVEVHMHGLGEKEEFRRIFVRKALLLTENRREDEF